MTARKRSLVKAMDAAKRYDRKRVELERAMERVEKLRKQLARANDAIFKVLPEGYGVSVGHDVGEPTKIGGPFESAEEGGSDDGN